jgi:hypothetical protein
MNTVPKQNDKVAQIPPKTVGDGQIIYKEPVVKIPKSIYIPAMYELKNSIIPGAGLGIFAKTDLPKNHILGNYKGTWLTPEQYMASPKELLYVWELYDYKGNKRDNGEKYDPNRVIGYIDGGLIKNSNFLRYLNHPRNNAEENVKAKQEKNQIIYYTCRPVSKGEELMVSYGEEYGKTLLGNH